MDLTKTDLLNLLQISEDTLLEWVESGKIPSYQLNHEYRFNREEIEEWMLRSLKEEDSVKEPYAGNQHFNLYRALHKGIVLTNIVGDSKQEVIANCMEIIAEQLDLDADVLTNLLLDREKLMSTALNHGVAVPHTRDSLLPKPYDVVVVAYLKEPIEYGALDREKVHTLFFLFASQDKRHLNLLAKIAYFCHQTENLELLRNKPSKKELLESVREWESRLNQLQPL